MTSGETYDYAQLAVRIKQVLGQRPSRSALRSAGTDARRTPTNDRRPRLTVGMPDPLPRQSPTAPALFSAEEIEAWLANHPRLAFDAAQARARADLVAGAGEAAVVAQARDDGLSWGVIARILSEVSGRPVPRATLHKRYGQAGD